MTGWAKIKKAAQYAGISERTLRTWLKEGLVYSRVRSGTVLIHKDDIDQFIRNFQVTKNEVKEIVDEVMEGVS